ncbi:MAG TPA: MATE family efflux transporter, partial [Clostridiales bacterium]|nr:MATE family efflux transporter [Clostridiales bacterium]
MNTKSLYKNLFILAVPIALQNMISLSIGLADSVMVGSLGELSISGVYICNQIQTVLQMLAAGIGAAQIVLAAQYWGKGDKESVKNIINIALRIAILCGLLFWTVVFFFPEKVLGLYTDDQQVLLEALKFARVVCFSYLFFCISNVLMASLRCIGTVKIGLYISIVSFILNIGLNWILIFGHLGAPKLGIVGAATATLTTRIVEFIIVVGYVLFVDKKLKYKLRDFSMHNWQLLKDFFRY